MQQHHPVFESRDSSVERSSTVAVVDAPWREGPVYPAGKADRTHAAAVCDNMGMVTQSMTYYTPLTHQNHGMVMSHSADGISAQAMLLASQRADYGTGSKLTSSMSEHYATTGYQHPNAAASSETAVNYIGPNYVYHAQHQHQHHHHHHSHDYHYVYHHHHHDRQPHQTQNQPQPLKPDPLTERNYHQAHNAPNPKGNQTAAEKPQKSESGGFLRKSFASFRAMRKPGSRSKEKECRTNSHADENDKCVVCPYPQPQGSDKNGSHKKQTKQSKKELKSLMKSKKNKHSSSTHDNQSEASWCSDNDTSRHNTSHHLHGFDTVPYTTMNTFPVRECSMEASISHHNVAGYRERMDQQYFDTASLSGYDSDVTKNRTGRSRSRIKTNPWLPSPQPSLTMGRRMENCRSHDINDDVIEDETSGCFPRSASFDYHGKLSVSTFLSSNGQNDYKRNIQRHRSLTPVDLKLNLSLPRTKKSEPPKPLEPKTHLNDLNTNSTKSRPNSILSPNSEFVALADNIEQLANNISFEYEDSFDTSLESTAASNRDLPSSGHRRRTTTETSSKKRKSDSSPPIPNDNVSISDNAHSPDSGIGCLGSCDGDDAMTSVNTVVLEQSPTVSIPSSQSTKSDSLNCTPKRKTTQSNRDTNNTRTKTSSLFSTTEPHTHNESRFGSKLNKSQRPLMPGQEPSRLIGSSSSESIASVVISESDIDNTSYKFVESGNLSNESSLIAIDPHKPQNVTPCLMVDERLDIDFRSLPRKLNGKQGKKRADNNGSYTITRSRNVIVENECTPSLVMFPNDPRPSSFSLTNVTKPKNATHNHSDKEGHSSCNKENHSGEIELKSDPFFDGNGGECEMAVNFVDLSSTAIKPEQETSESVAMDTVDACVQTDFQLDFDTWERKQPCGLSPLDDSFDPVESTRRWLISGNMQGSADTGYSSQARDSHVFMEEDAALLQLEMLSDTDGQKSNPTQQNKSKTNHPSNSQCNAKSKFSPPEFDTSSTCDCSSCFSCNARQISEQQQQTSRSNDNSLLTFHANNDVDKNESFFADCDLSKLLFGLKPPCENDYQELDKCGSVNKAFPPVNKRRNEERQLATSDVTKRHSSDSSTSTLTSDVIVTGDGDNDLLHFGNSNASFASCPTGQTSQSINRDNGQKESTSEDYHDYVNLPVRLFGAKNKNKPKPSLPLGNKTQTHKANAVNDEKSKHGQYRCIECSTASKPNTSSIDTFHHQREMPDKPIGKTTRNTNNSFQCGMEGPNIYDQDRPDYLEFLRDAPLQKPQASSISHLFIVPGFGPLEFPEGIMYPNHKENTRYFKNSNALAMGERKSVSPLGDKVSSRSKNTKSTKPKNKEDRPTNLKLMSYTCCSSTGVTETHRSTAESTKRDGNAQCIPSSNHNVKRKPYKDSNNKSERCPTVRSYDVDDFAPINRVDLTSTSSSSSSSSTQAAIQDYKSTGSTRNLAERVSLLRREKEIIYRKIQEIQQQQEHHRQREQFQQHRNLHSQRKEELLETLRVLKDKLEEQSKKLNMKSQEEM